MVKNCLFSLDFIVKDLSKKPKTNNNDVFIVYFQLLLFCLFQ